MKFVTSKANYDIKDINVFVIFIILIDKPYLFLQSLNFNDTLPFSLIFIISYICSTETKNGQMHVR